MKSILAKVQILGFLIALPALANDVGLHKGSAQPTRANQQTATVREHMLGVCEFMDPNGSGQADLFPAMHANDYFNTTDVKIDRSTAVITILQQPKHGRLEPTNSDGDWTDSRYLSNDGYVGIDSFVIQVEGNGYTVKLHYFVTVTDGVGETNTNPVCKGPYWKISSTFDADGNSTITSVEYQPALGGLNS